MDARKPYLLHLGSFVWERMHLVFAFAQGSHAEPHPADHFMFRQEYAKSTSESNQTSTGPIRKIRRDEKKATGSFEHSSILLYAGWMDDVAEIEVTPTRLRHGLSLQSVSSPKFPRNVGRKADREMGLPHLPVSKIPLCRINLRRSFMYISYITACGRDDSLKCIGKCCRK